MAEPGSLIYILAFSLLGSAGALAGGGILLAFPRLQFHFKTPLLSYAIGALLGAAFIGLLPEAIRLMPAERVLPITLFGFVLFFILEKILALPHQHAHETGHASERRPTTPFRPAGHLILIGDAFHNFVDGILITSAFLTSIELGIVTALAVVVHEVPQELGDFVILLESGMDRMRAYWLNFGVALSTLLGALLTYIFREALSGAVPYLLALSAASFLYIATVDLAPILHHDRGLKNGAKQTTGILAGIATILLINLWLH